MCFAPQRRALFRHHNFQKWSDAEVFCTFWLRNVLRATQAGAFSTSQLPKAFREWCILCILTSRGASRCNDVHFFNSSTSRSGVKVRCFWHLASNRASCHSPEHFSHISTSKSGSKLRSFEHFHFQICLWHTTKWLCTCRLSEPTFRPSGATNHLKNTVFWTFLPFPARGSSFFWDFLFLIFFLLLVSSLTLTTSAFLSVHIVGSLTSS